MEWESYVKIRRGKSEEREWKGFNNEYGRRVE